MLNIVVTESHSDCPIYDDVNCLVIRTETLMQTRTGFTSNKAVGARTVAKKRRNISWSFSSTWTNFGREHRVHIRKAATFLTWTVTLLGLFVAY